MGRGRREGQSKRGRRWWTHQVEDPLTGLQRGGGRHQPASHHDRDVAHNRLDRIRPHPILLSPAMIVAEVGSIVAA
ncbi:hypothetical protein AZA_57634 [Nitrospirillum viridazoti Y2]|nr:hypothetical protein AZA_57634 [Nitrospirillum amazonense Y2]